MGGALVKGDQGGVTQGRVLEDGRVVPPTPAQQALSMEALDIYTWDPAFPHSDDEPLSDMEWGETADWAPNTFIEIHILFYLRTIE